MGNTSTTQDGVRTLADLRQPFMSGCGDRFPQVWARLVSQAQIGGLENEAIAVRRIVFAAISDADPFIATMGRILSCRLTTAGNGLVTAA